MYTHSYVSARQPETDFLVKEELGVWRIEKDGVLWAEEERLTYALKKARELADEYSDALHPTKVRFHSTARRTISRLLRFWTRNLPY